MTPAPILYSFRRCPYAIRARLALLVSGTACELREVRLADKPPAMIAASPRGTVPVLMLPDGRVIDESLDIMRWALARHDPERWRDGDDGDLIAANDGPFKYHLDRYKYPDRHAADPAAHRAACLALLQVLEDRLALHPDLSGPQPGLTDAAILPFVRQFAATDRRWFDAQPLSGVQAWLARHVASPLFDAAMWRVAPWRSGDSPAMLPPTPASTAPAQRRGPRGSASGPPLRRVSGRP